MKNNKFVKISLLILSLVLVLGAAFATSIGAAETEKTPEIISQNVTYTDKFSLMYAVDASTVAEGPVELYLYEIEPTAETDYTFTTTVQAPTSGKESGLGVDAYIFTTPGIGAVELTQNFYVKVVDSADNESVIKRYSVAEYLYQRLSTTGDRAPTDSQARFYNNTIAFGRDAQIVIGEETNEDKLISNLRYVTVNGGTIEGFTTGVYPVGSTLMPKVSGAIAATWDVDTSDAADVATVANSYVLTNAAKTTLTVNTIKHYRDSVETFEAEKYKVGEFNAQANTWIDDHRLSITDLSTLTRYAIKADSADHGKVLSGKYYKWGDHVLIKQQTGFQDATLANPAYETSFDLKLNPVATDKDMFISLNPMIQDLNASGGNARYNLHQLRIYANHTTQTDGLYISNGSNTKEAALIEGVDPTDWFHVRVVFYNGDPNCYVYINGAEKASLILETMYYNATEAEKQNADNLGYEENPDITRIFSCEFKHANNNLTGTEWFMDNLFSGYISEANPNTP